MKLFIVLPTIDGREELLRKTMDGWRAQEIVSPIHGERSLEVESVSFALVRNHSTIGAAWQAGLESISQSADDSDFVVLAADDLVPRSERVLQAGIEFALSTYVPSPAIYENGELLHCGSLGGGQLLKLDRSYVQVATSPIPVFHFGAFRHLLDPLPAIHYYADDFVSWMLRSYDLDVRSCVEFAFDHLEGKLGREQLVRRAHDDRQTMLNEFSKRASDA